MRTGWGTRRLIDTAADLGRSHQSELVMDVRRALLNALDQWYPIVQQFHRFMVAVSRVAVNHDGRSGSASDPLVWDQRRKRKQRNTDFWVNVDLACLPMGPGFRWTVVVSLVLMWLPGRMVSACCASLLPFLGYSAVACWR